MAENANTRESQECGPPAGACVAELAQARDVRECVLREVGFARAAIHRFAPLSLRTTALIAPLLIVALTLVACGADPEPISVSDASVDPAPQMDARFDDAG
ncbi:MAG: hypothetical protein ACK4N5_07505, partial [Myxococcales bacterium]